MILKDSYFGKKNLHRKEGNLVVVHLLSCKREGLLHQCLLLNGIKPNSS